MGVDERESAKSGIVEYDSCSETGNDVPVLGATVIRAGKKYHALRELFSLPNDEKFADVYHCALKDKILIQGRLYIFEHHVCFYSNIFGIVTKKTIHVSTIKTLQQATHLYLHNSIAIHLSSGKRYFFTSFLSRDEAFELLHQSWTKCKNLDMDAVSVSESHTERETAAHLRLTEADEDGLGVADGLPVDDNGDFVWPLSTAEVPACPTTGKDPWTLGLELTLPTASLQDFSNLFKKDSDLFSQWHARREDTNVMYSDWIVQPNVGKIRDTTFTAKVRGAGPMAPSSADCHQTHRGCLHLENSSPLLVLQAEQTMPTIPFGEYFKVVTCWKVTPKKGTLSDPGIVLRIYVRVDFIKSTILANQITAGTIKGAKASWAKLAELLKQRFSPVGVASAAALDNPLEAAVKASLARMPTKWRHAVERALEPDSCDHKPRHWSDFRSLAPGDGKSWLLVAVAALLLVGLASVSDYLLWTAPLLPSSQTCSPYELARRDDRLQGVARELSALRSDVSSLRLFVGNRSRRKGGESGGLDESPCDEVEVAEQPEDSATAAGTASERGRPRWLRGAAGRAKQVTRSRSESVKEDVAALSVLLRSLQERLVERADDEA